MLAEGILGGDVSTVAEGAFTNEKYAPTQMSGPGERAGNGFAVACGPQAPAHHLDDLTLALPVGGVVDSLKVLGEIPIVVLLCDGDGGAELGKL